MNTRHRLTIEGEHRHWTISQSHSISDLWIISASPRMAIDNPARSVRFSAGDLTTAYDLWVEAEYADNGEHAE